MRTYKANFTHRAVCLLLTLATCISAWAEVLSGTLEFSETEGGSSGPYGTWSLDTSSGTLTIDGDSYHGYWVKLSSGLSLPYDSYKEFVKTVILGKNVKSIVASAFWNCSGLTSITIPNSVTSIGDNAFSGCSGLTSITIPNSVTSIGDNAFSGCSGLTSITVDASNPIYDSRDNCNAIIETATNSLILGCQATTIANSVTSIGYDAFSGCSGLTSITIPNSVTSIERRAFRGCSGLTSITIPNSVTRINSSAFSGCSGLTSITIPNSVTTIGSGAFQGCSGLTSITVDASNPIFDSRDNCNAIIETASNELISGCHATTIPNSVTSIGYDAFSGCSGLTSITIPNSVTSIGNYAFGGCSGLTSITIPNSVTSIGNYAFSGCSGLTSITVDASNPIYDSRENCNAIIETASNTLISGCKATTIPNSVTSIGDDAFNGCSGLTSITIPNSVTTIGGWAFDENTKVIFGDDITALDRIEASAEQQSVSPRSAQGVYDLSGRFLGKTTEGNGLYIKDGRLVLIKH